MTSTFAADLVAICVLVFALFHRRSDLVVTYLVVNLGVLAVSATLGASQVSAGLGLGLFGVLSIIRLRSDEIGQTEIAYYFAALALGLIGGLGLADPQLSIGLMALIVGVLALADSPRLLRRSRTQLIHLDRAFTDRDALRTHLEHLLGADVRRVHVRKLDLVADTTTVEVHYDTADPVPAAGPAAAQRAVR